MRKSFKKNLLCVSILCITLAGCSKASEKNEFSDLIKSYGQDSNYFLGLQSVEKGDNKSATKYFQKALSSKTKTISKLAANELISLSTEKNALIFASKLYKTYNDEDSLIVYLGELYNNKQYDKIISLTKDINLATTNPEIAFYKCAALLEKKDPSFPGIFNLWCSSQPFSIFQNRIFSMSKSFVGNDFAIITEIPKMQNASYLKDYGTASTYAKKILNEPNNLKPQIVSDAGKSLLYGSTAYESNAQFLESILTGEKEVDYFLYFYAGRIYSKQEEGISNALECLKAAMENSITDEQYDNALWYYLTILQDKSLKETVEETEIYCQKWRDPNYFDDFLESLSVQLLGEQKWELYYKTTMTIENYASPEAFSKFSYTTASLIENDFYLPSGANKTEMAKSFYEKALNGGCDSYHKLMAAAKLNLSDEETWKYFSLWCKNENFEVNEEVEKIFNGYVDFDLCQQIFPFWLEHYSEISLECVEKISEYIFEKAKEDADLYYTSLRVAAKKINFTETEIDDKLMKLAFPKAFSEPVEKYCDEYKLPNYVLYSLIRKESFYSPNAISHAGAIGLCQLMESTAGDIAKKLKIEDFDLNNPETNIQFGSNYIAELITRMEKNSLLAICSYNAGPGKIRSTLRKFTSQLKRKSIPNDIFLEMLPITETRKYGRDVTANAAIYAYIYFEKSPTQVMRELVF